MKIRSRLDTEQIGAGIMPDMITMNSRSVFGGLNTRMIDLWLV